LTDAEKQFAFRCVAHETENGVQVASESSPDTGYVVFCKANVWTCTCPDFDFRQRAVGGQCKHIRFVITGICGWEGDKPAIEGNEPICPKCDGQVKEVAA